MTNRTAPLSSRTGWRLGGIEVQLRGMAPRGRTQKHVCNRCKKSFPSGRALGGHMSRHWRIVDHPKKTPSPPAIVADMHVSLLQNPSDEETQPLSSGKHCQMCSKVFSASNALRVHMREHSKKNVLSKPVEGAPGLMDAMTISDSRCSVMFSPAVKRKRSKRVTPALNFDVMDAAVTLLLLSEHSKKILAYEDCYAEDMDSLSPNVSKAVKLNAYDHLPVQSAEIKRPKGHKCTASDDCYGECKKDTNLISNVPNENTLIPNIPSNSAYEDCYCQCEKDNSLISNVPDKDNNLIPNVYEKEQTLITNVSQKAVERNVLGRVLAGDNVLRKLKTDNSVVIKCGDLSAPVKVKNHQCNACGKSFGSGQALVGHMTCHHPGYNHRRYSFVGCPDSIVMEDQTKKLEWVSKLLDLGVPALTDRHYYIVANLSEPQPGRVSSVH